MTTLNLQKILHRHGVDSLLGLGFENGRMEMLWLRRAGGGVQIKQSAMASLSLDPLNAEPELIGREIRNHLDAAGLRERHCAVSLPLSWALALTIPLPDLPEADLASFLEIEAERNFPMGLDSLALANSRFQTQEGKKYATLLAVPKDHILRLERAVKAARLQPLSFTPGLTALPSFLGPSAPDGTLALYPGDSGISLQVSCGGGVAAVRTLAGTVQVNGSPRHIDCDHVSREIRITLGQLPPDVRQSIRHLCILGRSTAAEELASQLPPRLKSLGLASSPCFPGDGSTRILPEDASFSPALLAAATHLAGRPAPFEFLPPQTSAWQHLAGRYSSRKLLWTGATAGVAVLLVALAFLIQQWQLSRIQSRWAAMRSQVAEAEHLQQQIKLFRPWFNQSPHSLNVLRKLTEAFPEDGVVSTKRIEIRNAINITCNGIARDKQALFATQDKLRATAEIQSLQTEQIREQSRGNSPFQFTFNIRWNDQASQ